MLLNKKVSICYIIVMPKIDIKELTVTFLDRYKNEITAVDELTTSFENGKFSVILGESGSGKSTLIQAIIGLLPYYGDIFYDGVNAANIKIPQRDISYVSQDYVLYPNKKIFDNIAFPLRIKGCSREEIIERVYNVAERYNLTHCLFRKPKHLSGGQKQRVAIARALVKESSLYLFDEPFSNTDPQLKAEEIRLLKSNLQHIGATVIYVTHDIKEALLIADKIYVMEKGKVIYEGTPEEITESDNATVLGLLKASLDGIL